jgi:hypothetical protein
MAGRPSVNHGGFLVPNAPDVNDPVMAEPDRIDFNTVAHSQYGVIEGCEVVVDVRKAITTGGTAIVNGKLVIVRYGECNLTTGGAQDRFDLLVTDDKGTLTIIQGDPAVDPVFKDPPVDTTLLATVFCPSNTGDFNENVVDKRKFLPKALLTKISATDFLVQNRNATGNYFTISGQGDMEWTGPAGERPLKPTGTDVRMFRTSPATLRVEDFLEVGTKFTVTGTGGIDSSGPVRALQHNISGVNLKQGSAVPSTAYPNAPLAALYQQTDGRIWVKQSSGWVEIASIANAAPVGTIITSLEDPDVMLAMGWVPLNGQSVSETQFPNLFNIAALTAGRAIGTAPNRTMILPNATNRVLVTNFATAGTLGGSNTRTLGIEHLPAHKHNVNVNPGGKRAIVGSTRPNGGHKHIMLEGGTHPHDVHDDGHQHAGFEYQGNIMSPVVVFPAGTGSNSIDANFNDANHPLDADVLMWSGRAKAAIRVLASGSAHKHSMDPVDDHVHDVDIPDLPNHDHGATESLIGGGQSFSVQPAYLNVYTYIRS